MKKILIVEDELNMVNGLKDNLEFEGYEVDTAIEGRTGLHKILQFRYDLILLDIMLPEVIRIRYLQICPKRRCKHSDYPADSQG